MTKKYIIIKMKKTPQGKDKLNKIRAEIKVNRNQRNEREKNIIEKYLRRTKSYSPINNDLKMEKSESSFDLKNYLNARFNYINENINNVKNDVSQIKVVINEMKVDINEMKDISKYCFLISCLNKGLLPNELKARKDLGNYINKMFKNKGNNIPEDKEVKDNNSNKNRPFVQRKSNSTLRENEINFNNLTNYINIPRKRHPSIDKKINIKKQMAKTNKTPSDTLDSHSQSQSIKSAYSMNDKVTNLKKKKIEAKTKVKTQFKNLIKNVGKEEPKKPANQNIKYSNI